MKTFTIICSVIVAVSLVLILQVVLMAHSLPAPY